MVVVVRVAAAWVAAAREAAARETVALGLAAAMAMAAAPVGHLQAEWGALEAEAALGAEATV